MKETWEEIVLRNFDEAAKDYNNSAYIQKIIALELAQQCFNQSIQQGLWADLGSGTGLLAESLEKLHPNQSVIRVDISSKMINQHPIGSLSHICNLNLGLPTWSEAPSLLASSFVLHWLNQPSQRLKEWLNALAPGGWIAVALPIQGSFFEWHQAAERANVRCTAIKLPSLESLLGTVDSNNIRYRKVEVFTQKAPNITSLLKPIVKIGAQTSMEKSLTFTDWKKLAINWPRSEKSNEVSLTWLIQLLLIKR